MSRLIEVLASDGSQLGVTEKTIYGDHQQIGVGGAELALLTLCREWSRMGYEVILYNNPREVGVSEFAQKQIREFDLHKEHDILVAYRSPNHNVIAANAQQKIWWSCDQATIGNFKQFSSFVDEIVVISPYHKEFFEKTYGITNPIVIDLPVRIDEYINKNIEKIHNRVIFTSVPARGLNNLWRIWPLLQKEIPGINLVITSDYRLWGTGHAGDPVFRIKWAAHNDFHFLGAIPRQQLVEEQLRAQALVYPCNYDELFCIAVAEAQVAGAYPITPTIGALRSTNMGTLLEWNADDPRGDSAYVDTIKNLLLSSDFENRQKSLQKKAIERFDPRKIAEFWMERIFKI